MCTYSEVTMFISKGKLQLLISVILSNCIINVFIYLLYLNHQWKQVLQEYKEFKYL
jgi:hypothetical protein